MGPTNPQRILKFLSYLIQLQHCINSHFLIFCYEFFHERLSGAQNINLKAQQEISVGKRLKINLFVKCPVPISFTICTRILNSCMCQVFRPRGFREQELI